MRSPGLHPGRDDGVPKTQTSRTLPSPPSSLRGRHQHPSGPRSPDIRAKIRRPGLEEGLRPERTTRNGASRQRNRPGRDSMHPEEGIPNQSAFTPRKKGSTSGLTSGVWCGSCHLMHARQQGARGGGTIPVTESASRASSIHPARVSWDEAGRSAPAEGGDRNGPGHWPAERDGPIKELHVAMQQNATLAVEHPGKTEKEPRR